MTSWTLNLRLSVDNELEWITFSGYLENRAVHYHYRIIIKSLSFNTRDGGQYQITAQALGVCTPAHAANRHNSPFCFKALMHTDTHKCTHLSPVISNKCVSVTHTQLQPNTHTDSHTSSILSPVRRVPLCAAGLSGLMCLMKTPLIISPLLSLRPMPLPPIMLIPRDWPGARVSRTLKHKAGYKEHWKSFSQCWWIQGLCTPDEDLLGLKHYCKNAQEAELIQ